MDFFTSNASAILIFTAIISFFLLIFYVGRKIKKATIEVFEYGEGLEPYGTLSDIILTLSDKIQKKRQNLSINLPKFYENQERWLLDSQILKTFYYLDEEQVNNFYSQINIQPRIQEYSEREKKSSLLEGGIKNEILSINANKSTEIEATSKYVIDLDVVKKYNKVENYLKDNSLITFGIGNFYTDENQKTSFFEICDKIETEYKYRIDLETREKHWIKLNTENANPILEQIKDLSGNVAFQEDFLVIDREEHFEISYVHPINQYLEADDKKVSISCLLPKNNLTSTGKSYVIAGKYIKATCIGKIIRWDEKERCLVINPVAIFS